MGAAIYIALQKEIPNFDSIIDGKMLSNAEKQLSKAAKRLKVPELMSFFSTNADEVASLLGDEAGDIDVPEEKWYTAEEGLTTVNALIAEVERTPALASAKEDLLGCQRVLLEAQKHGIKWHLAVDY